MKKIFAFLLALLGIGCSQTASAQRGRGQIAVHSEDGEKLGIAVGGRRYDRFSADFLLGNIPTGRRFITVYRLRPHRSDGGATAQTVYEGQLLVRADYRILLNVNAQNGSVSIQHQDLSANASRMEGTTPNPPARTPPLALPQETTPQISGWKADVNSQTTDTEKLRILKARVTASAVRAADLAEMMGALAFEDSRLELAQAALPTLADRENLSTVSAALESVESRKTLEASARRLW